MKSRFTKVAAAAMAVAMCLPTAAFATSTTPTPAPTSGSFDTSFDVYSPKLTVSVPVKLDVEVNPIADTSATGVRKFTVASNSIDVLNASVDVEADTAIPVNVTVKATIASKKDDVVTEYNSFTVDKTSTKKRINLNLSEAGTAATMEVKDGGTASFDADKKLDLSQYVVDTAAVYTSPKTSTSITKYGSLLSVDIAGPTTSNTTDTGETFSKNASDVTPAVGSFAVTGTANTNADWKADDVQVAVTYNVKASQELEITTPAIANAPTFTAGASAADVEIVVPNVGEATVVAMALHNDNDGLYGDFLFEEASYEVAYAPNATTNTQTDATITIPKDSGVLAFLAEKNYNKKEQDLVIALSDGRYVVSTLTVTAATP